MSAAVVSAGAPPGVFELQEDGDGFRICRVVSTAGKMYQFRELSGAELDECAELDVSNRRRGWAICAYSMLDDTGARRFADPAEALAWLDRQPGRIMVGPVQTGGNLVNEPETDNPER